MGESKRVLLSGQCGQINSRKLLSELATTEHTAQLNIVLLLSLDLSQEPVYKGSYIKFMCE